MSSLRYAHSEGHTDICFSEDSRFILTCGSEGDVRVWEGIDDADQRDVCVGEKAWSVAQKGKNLYVGTDNNIVQAYTFPELEMDGIITRFTAPATQIDITPNGKTLVAGSCDMLIHVVNVLTMECKKLSGHRAPVLSVSVDSRAEFVASSSCDGTVRVWSIDKGQVEKEWADVVPKSNSFESSESLCRIHFNSSGRHLAVPHASCIRIYERGSWAQTQTFSTVNDEQTFSIVKFSSNGDKIAGGTTKGSIYIWNMEGVLLAKETSDSAENSITGISWMAKESGIVFCNVSGQIGELKVPQVKSKMEAPAIDPGDIPLGEPTFHDDDDDDDNVISLEKIKASSALPEGPNKSPPSPGSIDGNDSESEAGSLRRPAGPPLSEIQQPFQPTSTPIHLQQRFMVWNDIGIVRQFNSETMNDIEVEFHDSSFHHGIRVKNLLGHNMATLTSQALILACPQTTNASKLVVVLLKSSDGQKEWEVAMEYGEEIVGVCGGTSWVAVVTEPNRLLRVFSIDGTQIDIISLPGPFVSIAGRSNSLAVFYHSGTGIEKDRHMSFIEMKLNPRTRIISRKFGGDLPLASGSVLRWVGYTEEGTLGVMDSSFILKLLYSQVWRPICAMDEHCKSQFDHYFVVNVIEKEHIVQCILCKGSNYPPVVPKPLVAQVKWQMPLCNLKSEKSQLEETLLRSTLTVMNLPESTYDDSRSTIEKSISVTLMKLFALACRSDMDGRAIALCEAMPNAEVVKLAAKYAAKLGRNQLAERVNEQASAMIPHNFELPSEEAPEESSPPAVREQYSQEMFEDSDSVKENLILKMMKKKSEAVSPKPIRVAKRQSNPFKRASLDISMDNLDDSTTETKPNYMDWYSQNRDRLQAENPMLKEGELAIVGMKQYKAKYNKVSNMETPKQPQESQDCEPSIIESTNKRKTMESEKTPEPVKKKSLSDAFKKGGVSATSKLQKFSFHKK